MGYPDPSSWRHCLLVPIQEGPTRSVVLLILEAVEEIAWGEMEETNEGSDEGEDSDIMGELSQAFDKAM